MVKIKFISVMLILSMLLTACVSKQTAAVNNSVEGDTVNTVVQAPIPTTPVEEKTKESKVEEKAAETTKVEVPKTTTITPTKTSTTKTKTSTTTKTTTPTASTGTSTTLTPTAPDPKQTATPLVPVAPATLSTTLQYLLYTANYDHITPVPKKEEHKNWLSKYNGYLTYNSNQKVIYLTFDEGYENGYTPKILDTLKAHGIKASFFATKPFITKNPHLVRRMINEGHIVLNHSVTHPSFATLTEQQIYDELKGVEDAYTAVTGKTMIKQVRPPKGEFSEKSLWVSNQLGYKSIFWSMAYLDWDTNNQKTPEYAMNWLKTNHHNGAIILLHAVSKTNADTLGDMLTYLKSLGYSFRLTTELN